MNMVEIKEKATTLDIKPGKMKKADLIRSIQKKEGNFECFDTAEDFCDQDECCWQDDCLVL